MALIKPFKAVRPKPEQAQSVAAPPYDVMNVAEARKMATGLPYSFLHISRPEIDLPEDIDIHSEPVYQQGKANLAAFIEKGILSQDQNERYYVYRQQMGNLTQTGLVACASIDDYKDGLIKKHELTRADKEDDRVRHIDLLNANDEPVFLTYRFDPAIGKLIDQAASCDPEYDFTADDGVRHTLWVIRESSVINQLTSLFGRIPAMYVADGHHRSAAASRVRDIRAAANSGHTGNEEYNYFLTVIFPDNEMNIMPYNRVVQDLNRLTTAELIARVSERFDITPVSQPVEPGKRHQFGMYLASKWYGMTPRVGSFDASEPVSRLDVSILQDNLLNHVLGIRNPRTDQRIHFVGGIRGLAELEKLVDSSEYAVAFSLYPTSIDELMELADADRIMPPKSTWFEPKLRSGLFLHLLS